MYMQLLAAVLVSSRWARRARVTIEWNKLELASCSVVQHSMYKKPVRCLSSFVAMAEELLWSPVDLASVYYSCTCTRGTVFELLFCSRVAISVFWNIHT